MAKKCIGERSFAGEQSNEDAKMENEAYGLAE